MKNGRKHLKASVIVAALIGPMAAFTWVAGHFASAFERDGRFPIRRDHDPRSEFMLGVCVGEALEQQGLSLPQPQPGEEPQALDSPTQSALEEATRTCREQMNGAEPSPTPSAEPTATPTATATPAPTATATPAPTATSPSTAPTGDGN